MSVEKTELIIRSHRTQPCDLCKADPPIIFYGDITLYITLQDSNVAGHFFSTFLSKFTISVFGGRGLQYSNGMAAESLKKVKILVLGDSGEQ